jgi:phosphoglycerol transferase MdoB-like AlkP superfamily enzyme
VHLLAASVLLYLGVFGLLRLVFYFGVSGIDHTHAAPLGETLQVFSIGARFDLRLAVLLNLPLAMLLFMPRMNMFSLKVLRHAHCALCGMVNAGIFLFYILDFGHYDYLGIRINSTVLHFLEDAEWGPMLWQSYPVLRLVLLLLALTALVTWLNLHLLRHVLHRPEPTHNTASTIMGTVTLLTLMLLGFLGRVGAINVFNPIPLRWNAVHITNHAALAQTGLNPIVFFFETLKERPEGYDLDRVRESYPAVAEYLGLPAETLAQTEAPDIDRIVPAATPRMTAAATPNIVFIMLESLGASRVSHYGLPFESTPVLDRLARDGIVFERFYVPVSGTARTVWATLTGIPDISLKSTASRNPMLTDQRSIVNSFAEHDKYYFIGGNISWANMSGVIRKAIRGVALFEEKHWQDPVVDVWGISDLDLFRNADRILRERAQSGKPFFAFIQTAANHRPYTIPKNNDGFVVDPRSEAELAAFGFQSRAQYNATRLLDFNIGRFLEMAEASGYLGNTIFVLYGDHNSRITTTPHMPAFNEPLDLDGLHVPGIIYAPGMLEPRSIGYAVSLVDLLPTVAGLLGIEYLNTALGRDALAHNPQEARFVYTQDGANTNPYIGLVSRTRMLRMRAESGEARLHDLTSPDPVADISDREPEVFAHLRRQAKGIYEYSRFLLYKNVQAHPAATGNGEASGCRLDRQGGMTPEARLPVRGSPVSAPATGRQGPGGT